MKPFTITSFAVASAIAAVSAAPAQAALIISEVAPWGSNAAGYAADWFELTNIGALAVNISNWRIDDNSNTNASAVLLRGVTSIGAGRSVIFLEGNTSGSNDASINAAFITAWFGASPPVGFTVGNYGGPGVGLNTANDAVNIFDATGALVTRVDFGASTTAAIFRSFDNRAGLNNVSISQLSTVGVNGAFSSADGSSIGSPGTVVPLPAALPLLLSGLGVFGAAVRKRRAK